LALLDRLGHDTSALHSKSWDAFAQGPEFDFIFTVCDNAASEVCPVWPGHPMTAHWGMPDPAAVQGDEITVTKAFRDAYAALERRIGVFATLPFKSLDRLALKKRLDTIGLHAD
jgi:arsenate reductase